MILSAEIVGLFPECPFGEFGQIFKSTFGSTAIVGRPGSNACQLVKKLSKLPGIA